MTTDYIKTDELYKPEETDWTQFTEDTESAFAQTKIPTNIHTANKIFTNIILMAEQHNTRKGKIHSNFRYTKIQAKYGEGALLTTDQLGEFD